MSRPKRRKFFEAGTIARLTSRGFGFIARTGNEKDLFFHSNELMDIEFAELREGDLVGFEILEGSKGLTAVNIGRDGSSFDEEKTDEEIIDDEGIDVSEEVRVAIDNLSNTLAVIIAKDPAALESLEWRDLERLVAEVFSGLGFDVELTPGSKDRGKDVVVNFTVSDKTRSYLVEIKHWRSGKRVGKGAIMEFLHVIARENRIGGLFLATKGYSDNAIENITEIDRKKIGFGTDEKVVSLCRNYVKAKEGTWYPPEQREKVIFEDTD